MKNRHHQKRNDTIKQKALIESLIFQTNWGIKKIYGSPEDSITEIIKTELDCIVELNLVEDLLIIKKFVDDVKSAFNIKPVAERGDFCNSCVAFALGIGGMNVITELNMPADWKRLAEKKILSIYYPNDVRNSIVDYAKQNGYNVSTYLGKPMIKLSKLFVLLDRTK
jgi:hypothetical protein